jgi:hypothetical protein
MNKSLLMDLDRHLVRVPRPVWQGDVARNAQQTRSRIAFMSPDHHRVRDFVVTELPHAGRPLTPETIAGRLGLPLDRVSLILDELEKHLTFLFRDTAGAVAWAYPVTVEPTPHRVHFSTGEQIYAA